MSATEPTEKLWPIHEMSQTRKRPEAREHQHRRPTKKDFEGKTVKRFVRSADNMWRLYFTDGTAFAIQSELFSGLACMEVCDVCARA